MAGYSDAPSQMLQGGTLIYTVWEKERKEIEE
ncbi:hypothetical protein E2C01_048226 [Portunus trituberculatus]|uniref:Uncharacterized protein n=1 Tax=Portunus trituberculatus TaxID=210409 RepID=A0A5B7GA10_PORTR|nr:hypothetical protein [Portunus trituberculatus]